MKRFYKEVGLDEAEAGWQVTLDGRGLKTVKGTPQIVPSIGLAEALAEEWRAQPETLDTTKFVFRDMADYAIDIVQYERSSVIDKLLAYIETDTLCYRADPDDALYAEQKKVWEPLVRQFEAGFEVKLVRISGIIHRPQNEATHAALRTLLERKTPLALAALETLASLAASLSVALLAELNPDTADSLWDAVSLEEEWQADLWGRDHEAEERREKRRGDFLKAVDFLRLARS